MTFQQEHAEWLEANFPNQNPWMPAASMVEEAGELFHALLKLEQSKAYGRESRYVDCDFAAMLVNAVGDCAIYCCSLCNSNGWSYSELTGSFDVQGSTLLQLASEMLQCAAKLAVNPGVKLHATLYMGLLRHIAVVCDVDFDVAVATTWREVKARKCR